MNSGALQAYLNLILDERHWSWTLAAAAYLLLGLCFRGIVLGSLLSQAKLTHARFFSTIKHNYLRRAFPGWFFFYFGAVLTALAWLKARQLPLSREEWCLVIGAVFLYFWSLLLHAKAMASAAFEALREAAVEKTAEALVKSKSLDT